MSAIEANRIMDELMQWYRAMTYGDLVAVVDKYVGCVQVTTPPGTEYDIQTIVGWDDIDARTNVRVIVVISDADGSETVDEFIVNPNGGFVGE